MGDFVTGLSDLANDKADTVPTATNSNTLIADEWNEVADACYDLRTAILSGQFFGLAEYEAPVSGASEARLRYFDGKIQASLDTGPYRTVGGHEGFFYPEDYGAVADGVTDDAVALQACIDAADSYGVGTVVLQPGATYRTDTELVLRSIVVEGNYANITTGAAIRSLMRGQDVTPHLKNINFDGARSSTYCLLLQTISLARFDGIGVQGSLADGVFCSDVKNDDVTHAINDANVWRDFAAGGCGTLYITSALNTAETGLYGFFTSTKQIVAGSCSFATSDNTITFTGIDLTTLGLRRGDPIRVGDGANKRFAMIQTITDATHLEADFDTANGQSDITANTQGFAIGRGDGYHEARSSDNNINVFEGRGLHRGNAGYAFAFDGIYGPRMYGSFQIDFHPAWFIRVGSSGGNPVIHPTFYGMYFESGGAVKPWLLKTFQDGYIDFCLDNNGPVADNVSYCGSSSTVSGVYLTADGYESLGANVFENNLASTYLTNALSSGFLQHESRLLSEGGAPGYDWDHTDTSDLGASVSRLYAWSGGDVTATGTPLFNNLADRFLTLGVYEANSDTVTLQDESLLTGSGFRLQKPRLRMAAGRAAYFFNDGYRWCEIGRSRGDSPDDTGTPGNATQHSEIGRVAIAAGASSVTVTNDLVDSNSIIHATLQTSDATLTQILTVVPGSGSFVITGNALATGDCNICWTLEG